MTRRVLPIALAALALVFASCRQDPDITYPSDGAGQFIAQTHPPTSTMRNAMEGVYEVLDGKDLVGDLLVLKWSTTVEEGTPVQRLSTFGGKQVFISILEGGSLDSVFFFTGTWRKIANTETGLFRFVINKSEGGDLLFQQSPQVRAGDITLRGTWGAGQDAPTQPITLRWLRPLYQPARPFDVMAHRAGGRTSDLLPVSENSLPMIRYTERLGSTGVEIDVHLTKDRVPILYHDSNLNLRLTQKNGLVGPVEEYTYQQISSMVRLIHGEKIPTLREALDVVVYETGLRVVWLDMKADQKSMPEVRSIQKEYLQKAAAAGKHLEIYIGLPTQDKVDEFLTLPDYADAPNLCELSLDLVRSTKAEVWAPRWTLGTQNADVAQMQAEGRRVFNWTMDDAAYIEQFLRDGLFDGILTNYPSLVAYYHYIRQ